jgi:hypothetical protein
MAGTQTILDAGLILTGLFILQRLLARQKQKAPLPPGPKRWPLIGNLLDMPTSKEWLTFTDWGEKWGEWLSILVILILTCCPDSGDMVSISVFSQQMIIVNSVEVAIAMLDRKGSIYSNRPVIQMAGELIGWKHTTALQNYGERLRSHRRFFSRLIGTSQTMSQYHALEEMETHKLLKRLLASPQDLPDHIRK